LRSWGLAAAPAARSRKEGLMIGDDNRTSVFTEKKNSYEFEREPESSAVLGMAGHVETYTDRGSLHQDWETPREKC